MSDTESATKEIVVSEDFPNRPETLWKALTTGTLIERWMGMAPVGFEARPGNRFTFQTSSAGAWDRTISCEVIEAVPNESSSIHGRAEMPKTRDMARHLKRS